MVFEFHEDLLNVYFFNIKNCIMMFLLSINALFNLFSSRKYSPKPLLLSCHLKKNIWSEVKFLKNKN